MSACRRFNSGPRGAIVVGSVNCGALVWAVQHDFAVSRKYHQALRALECGLHAVPCLAHVVAAVHHVEILRIVLAVNGNHTCANQASGERGVTHAFGGADGWLVALCALLDVCINGAVVVANSGDQRASRNAHDVEGHSLFDTLGHKLPKGNLCGDVFGHEDAVTASDPGLLVVERVDFERTRPVDGVARNPVGAVGVDVRNVVVVLAVIPSLAAVCGGIDAVAVVFLFVFGHVAAGVLAQRRNHNVVLVLGVNGDAAVRALVLFVALGGAAFVFHGIARGEVGPRAASDVVLVETAACDVVRAGAVGERHVHVAVDNLCAVGHESSGDALDGFPGSAAVVAYLQIILGFGNADVDGLGRTVGVLALRLVEHHEADAVHAVQAGFLWR